MPIADFVTNFDLLSLVRFFNEDYVEIFYESEWSAEKGTDGGCANFETTGNNP
jgi:hypothetical protein